MSPRSVVVISGGTSGIGRATVELLSGRGHIVVFNGRDESAGRLILQRCPLAQYIPGDIAADGTIDRIVEAAMDLGGGKICGLVNCAGISRRQAFQDSTLADWDEVFGVNARAAFALTRASLNGLIAGQGAVVFVSSVAGHVGEAGLAIYTASKAALIGMARSLALELGSVVRFNAVCPGQIETRMMAGVLADRNRRDAIEMRIPRGRVGSAEEVAATIAWLLSAEAAFVNGAVMPVDGGECAGLLQEAVPRQPRSQQSYR